MYTVENFTDRAEKTLGSYPIISAIREDDEDDTGYRNILTIRVPDEETFEQAIERIEDENPERYCQHSYDCCGGWYCRRPSFYQVGHTTLVVVFSHYQNV